MEMAHSVEGRVPFLDHKVVELATKLPVTQKIRETTHKLVLREAARPWLTDRVYRRRKHPFLAPPAALAPSGRLFELMQDSLRGGSLGKMPLFDRDKVVKLLDLLPSLDGDERALADELCMTVLSACVLEERLGLQT